MSLSESSVAWLRELDRSLDGLDGDERIAAAYRLGSLTHLTPAWPEVHEGLLARLRGEPTSATHAPTGPQVVDVDFPTLVLSRAEWRGGGLYLTLDPIDPDPSRFTEFRIVGVEPRIWDVAGIDRTSTEVRSAGVVVRTQLVRGDLEFTPGSY